MRALTLAIVGLGIALALALGFNQGFDATSLTILVSIVLVGSLAIAASGRWTRGAIRPALCSACGGVISPNAPFCKHCGARAAR